MNRSGMTGEERESRSRIKPYIDHEEMVRGTLSIRARTCGNPNCKCARGEKHVSLYLVRSKDGKVEQLYIPKDREEPVRRWVENWHEVKANLEEISSSYWERLKRKE
ncbi:MAG: hypothetical protein KJ625_06650 [Actinobacteria bacterium]|nr:hypothetical protein [Actinomycetota bacterium]